jgi:hypothetical protein
MSKKFAVIDGTNILNTIVCDSKTVAEELTGKTCIEFTDEPAEVGGTYVSNKFRRVKPYPSWVYDGNHDWNPPVPYPIEDGKAYTWDEESTSWVEITIE